MVILINEQVTERLLGAAFAAEIAVEAEVKLPVVHKGTTLDMGFRLDLLVGGSVVVEVKAVQRILPIHRARLLTYLKLSGRRVGLLLNFNTAHLRDGITRIVL